jgi:hypothetical protein
MTEQRSTVDHVLDRLVYAPLGLVTDAKAVVPQLAEKGRVQVANAKLMGHFAVKMGSSEATKRVGGLEQHLRGLLVGFGFLPPEVAIDGEASSNGESPRSARPRSTSGPATGGRGAASSRRTASTRATSGAKPKPKTAPRKPTGSRSKAHQRGRGASLAIPDYDSLAASQVVARLAGLRPTELSAVQEYERTHRARKTILGKIAQLRNS